MKAHRIASLGGATVLAVTALAGIGAMIAETSMEMRAQDDMRVLAATMHDPAMSIIGDMWGCSDPADAMVREEVERTLLEEGGRCSSFRAPFSVSESAGAAVRLTVFPSRGRTVHVWTPASELPL